MTDGEALLRAIIAHPDEDVPRLAYADVLDEQNEPARAEFIRLQCDSARLDQVVMNGIFTPGPPSNAPDTSKEFAKLCENRKRERELIAAGVEYVPGRAYRHVWFPLDLGTGYSVRIDRPDAIGLITGDGLRVSAAFRRGFVLRSQLPADDWLAHADAILVAHPVQEVTLTTWPDVMEMYRLCQKNGMGESPGNRIERWKEILAAEWKTVKTWNLPQPQT